MIKTLGIALASLGLASAQSWTDPAGVCPKVMERPDDFKEPNTYYPKEEDITLDNPSLQDMVFEFESEVAKGDPNYAKCFYFTTQVIPGKSQEESPKYCIDSNAKKDSEDGKLTYSEKVPLWNVRKITTQYEGEKIYDISFQMRYTNVSDPKGYYQWDDAAKTLIDNAVAAGTLQSAVGVDASNLVINSKEPTILAQQDDGSFQWAEVGWGDLLAVDGSYLQKFWNVSMIKYDDVIAVKLEQAPSNTILKSGCAVDILAGSTLKGAKLHTEEGRTYLANLAFRVQPIEEYYDTIHSYSQNGDMYTVGYDNDFYDGKIEYTANGYSPQSVSWKLSRSLSTTVVTSALAIAGALLGSIAV